MTTPALHVPESEVIMADVHPLVITVMQNPYYQSPKVDDQANTSTHVDARPTSGGENTAAGDESREEGVSGVEKDIAAATALCARSEEKSDAEASSKPATAISYETIIPPADATTRELQEPTAVADTAAPDKITARSPAVVSDADKAGATIDTSPVDSEKAVKDGRKAVDSESVETPASESVIRQRPGIASGSIKPVASPVPVIAHASSATPAATSLPKDGPRPSKENERITKLPAEKLKVGEAELLSLSHLQQKQAAALRFAEGTGGKVTQVAVIPPIVDPSRSIENRGLVMGEGGTGLAQMLNIEKRANAIPEEATKDGDVVITSVTKATMPGMAGMAGMTGMIKISSQQTVKKHWTTSWKPLSTAALERIGLDSKGNGYWYDGGRNLFQSPPSADTSQLPAETDMQLVCKSMVQWMAKLKELRSSTAEADSKLAQVIKDQFIARVRVATQRKPKDPAAIQRMIAQSQSLMKVQSAIANANINKHPEPSSVAQATTTTTTTESTKATVLPPSFPQGSILVVPHPHHPFRAVPLLPVFANTAVMVPQSATGQQPVAIESTASSAVTISDGAQASTSSSTTSVVQSSTSNVGSKEGAIVSRESSSKDSPTPATIMTIANLPPQIQQALAAAGGLSDSRQPVALPTGLPFVPTMVMTVSEAVPLGTIDFESKSIEITGEVPIRKVELDSLDEASNVADEGRLLPAMSNSKEGNEAGVREGSKEGEIDEVKAAKEKDEPQTPSLTVLQGRTSQEVMSAKMLLSLTGRAAGKDWPISPLDKDAPPQVFLTPPAAPLQLQEGMVHVPATVSITPAISGGYGANNSTPPTSTPTPATPSSRKRKQKPTPSARASDIALTPDSSTVKHDGILLPTTSSKGRRIRKPKQMDDEDASPRRDRKHQLKAGDNTSREFTPEELLSILGIPPSTETLSPLKEKTPSSKGRQRSSGTKAREKDEVDAMEMLQGSEASAKMQQLKAERESKPMKEYVIETDSESDSSSSGTSSFSPNSGSSSDSSSDSSSEGGPPSEDAKPPPKKSAAVRGGRGRGRVGRGQRQRRAAGSAQSSSSDESSSEDETNEEKGVTSVKRGRGRGRGGTIGTRGGRRQSRGQIVSIPTSLLMQTPLAGKKRRSSGHEVEDKDRRRLELIPEGPLDLASFYSNQGGVDLGTLSELTQSVKHGAEDEGAGSGSRSKRTCVRVREEISKLQEILEDIDTEDPKAANAVGAKSKGRGRGRGQASGGGVSNEVGREGGSGVDAGSADLGIPAVKKYRRPAYRSQFTHKRRKKRKKQPEEEALWQPARKRPAGETLRPIYVFSTNLANKAAEWVIRGKYDNIIQFHNAQPKGPGFLRLPEAEPQKPPVGGETETKTGGWGKKLTETTDSEDTPAKGSKPAQRRSSRLSTDENRHESPRVTRLRSHKNVNQSADSEEPDVKTPPPPAAPPPPVRSSRRLRSRQQAGSDSPPTSPLPPQESPPPPAPSRRTRSRAQASETPPQRVTRSRRVLTPEPQAESSSVEGEPDTEEQEEAEEENKPSEGGTREEMNNGESEGRGVGEDRRGEEDGGVQQRSDDRSSGLQSPPLDMVGEGPYGSDALSETNYTICHGTPSARSPPNDISSPSSSRIKAGWPQQQPRQPQSVRTPTTPATETYSPSGSSVSGQAVGRQVATQSPGVNATESVIAQHLTQDHHHRDVNWGHANIAPQFPPVPGGYPSVYNPSLHSMPYPPPGQAIPGANYPYPMPYPWPHAHAHGVAPAHIGGSHPKSYHDPQAFHAQEMLHQQRVAAAAEGTPQSQHLSHHHHHQYPPSSLIQTWSSQQPTPSLPSRSAMEVTKDSMTAFSPQQDPNLAQTQPVVKSPAMEKLPLSNAQTPTGFPPPPTLHQLPTPGSQPSLSHQVPHGFARGPHALSPEHIQPGTSPHPHAAFAYPFEPSPHHALSPMHMWQQSQMQAAPIRHLPGMHPTAHIQPHLSPHGMWYPHVAPLMAGVDPAGGGGGGGGNSLKPGDGKKGGKSGSKAAQMDGAEKINTNRNVNNNNNGISAIGSAVAQSGGSSSQSLYAAQYQAQAFSQRQAVSKRSGSSSCNSGFSVEQLTSSYHKEPAAYSELLQSHVARGATWTPPAHQSGAHKDFGSKLGGTVVSGQSADAHPGQQHLVPTTAYHSAPGPANQNLPYLHALPKRLGSITTVIEDDENMATSAVLERTRRNTEIVGEMASS